MMKEESMNLFQRIINHSKTILIHKWWVFYYCCKFGIIWRGLMHDNSKFSLIEFCESIKYYKKGSSPIPRCKMDKGYSEAWQHHRGHNDHHYEYWVDYLDMGGIAIKMPFECVLEMIADWLAACRTYSGNIDIYDKEYIWWEHTKGRNPKIHKKTIELVDNILSGLMVNSNYFKYWGKRFGPQLKKYYMGDDENLD